MYMATIYNTMNCMTNNPAVTVTLPTARALVIVTAQMSMMGGTSAGNVQGWTSFAVSGSSNIGATDANALMIGMTGSSTAPDLHEGRASAMVYLNTLTAGSNTFTLQYKSPGGDIITILNRSITVIPLP